jgi:hypothetical protein
MLNLMDSYFCYSCLRLHTSYCTYYMDDNDGGKVTLSACHLRPLVPLASRAAPTEVGEGDRRQDRELNSMSLGLSVEVEHSYAGLVPKGYSPQSAHPIIGCPTTPLQFLLGLRKVSTSLNLRNLREKTNSIYINSETPSVPPKGIPRE